jgi:tetratricopeptide (TPR) repeat protein
MVRLQQARYEEAREALVKAAAADPRSPKADYQLSLVYARLGDTAAAEASVESYKRKLAEMNARVAAMRATPVTGPTKPGGGR